MCGKGCSKLSLQKGNLLTVQISVFFIPVSSFVFSQVGIGRSTHRLQCLLNLSVECTSLEGDNRRGRIRVMGNRRATLGAEETVDVLARASLARVFLDRTVDGQYIFGDDGDEGCIGVLVGAMDFA